jgi:hypothetical protein
MDPEISPQKPSEAPTPGNAGNTPMPAVPPPVEPAPPPANVPPASVGGSPFAGSLQKLKRQKITIAVSGAIFLILGITYFFFLSNKGGILVLDTSKDLTITLNDRPADIQQKPNGIYVPAYAGQYRLKISKPTYLPFTLDINLKKGENLNVLPAYTLLPRTEQQAASSVDYVRPAADQKSVFYLGDNRQTIYHADVITTVQTPLTDKPLVGVSDVQWSSDPSVALITQSNGVYLHEIPKFDFENQILLRLGGSEIISPIWDPTNTGRIAFVYEPNTGEKSLVFADKRLSKIDRKADIKDLNLVNPKLVWSRNSSYIALISRSTDTNQNNMWVYTTANGSLTQVTTAGNVTDASFSPNETTVLYESYATDPSNPLNAYLSTMGIDGGNKKPLNLPGKIARTAWKDDSSFFLPSLDRNILSVYSLSGSRQDVPFSFPNLISIQGIYYFPKTSSLIFYTDRSIYTINL